MKNLSIKMILGWVIIIWGLIFIVGVFSSWWVFLFFLYGILMCIGGICLIKNRKLLAVISVSVFIISIVLSLFLILKKDEENISVDNDSYKVNLPLLIKFAALIEREESYRTWVDEIMSKGITDDEDRINKIFDWINNFPDLSQVQALYKNFPKEYVFKNINQHEYYVLIKQYGPLYERIENFCNLITVAGYQASKIYGGGTGKVIVRIPNTNPEKEKFLYFDLETGGKNPVGISDSDKEESKRELRRLDNFAKKFMARKYLWADLNVSRYVSIYYLQKLIGSKIDRKENLIER